MILLVGTRLAALGSELLGSVTLATGDWVVLALLPPAYVLLATIVARVAVVTRLRRTL